MANIDMGNQVSDQLEILEDMAKKGMTDITYLNRCLEYCQLIYNKGIINGTTVEQAVKDGLINSSINFQIFKGEPKLIDESVLGEFVTKTLRNLYEDYAASL